MNKVNDFLQKKKDLISGLLKDMGRELAHWTFYTYAGNVVSGLHREELQEFFYKQSNSEFQHIQMFAKMLLGLGCQNLPFLPDELTVESYCNGNTPKELLNNAISMERQVVSNYVLRMQQAAELGDDDGAYIEIFLEDQILDSRSDVDHMLQMVKGIG